MDIMQTMQAVGLNPMECRTYLALLELEESKTGPLCEQAKVASSNIYKVLRSLMDKGLASYRVQNNVKIYMPSPPEALQELFHQQEEQLRSQGKELLEVISNLKKRAIQERPYSRYKYYEGIAGLKSLWTEMLDNNDKKDVIRTFLHSDPDRNPMLGYFHEWHDRRIQKHIQIRMVFPSHSALGLKRAKQPFTDVRFLPNQTGESTWGTMGPYLYLEYSVGKHPRGFLIHDEIFVHAFNVVFDQIWNTASRTPQQKIL